MVCMMYDVQPVEDNWRIKDPFAGERVETVLMARGATNQKGPQRAFLNALDATLKVEGTLPVNLLVVAGGECAGPFALISATATAVVSGPMQLGAGP
jgi:acetylornithine deacetylase/succinyl-diaminopimelate desuccinylase-like protein